MPTETHESYKKRMKLQVVASLIAVALPYFLFLFPEAALDYVLAVFKQRAGLWSKLLGGAAGSITLASFLSFVLFASDSAFKGAGTTARWVQSMFASGEAKKRYSCSESEASALWFKYFDTWALPDSPNYELLKNSYSATYSARLVFYLQKALAILSVLGFVSVALNSIVFGSYSGPRGATALFVHAFVLFILLIGGLALLTRANRIRSDGQAATGCWKRVEDIFGRSSAVFNQDVLSKASSLNDAFLLVEAIRANLSNPPQQPAALPTFDFNWRDLGGGNLKTWHTDPSLPNAAVLFLKEGAMELTQAYRAAPGSTNAFTWTAVTVVGDLDALELRDATGRTIARGAFNAGLGEV